MIIREAKSSDIQLLQLVRNSVLENTLSDPGLITDEDYKQYITLRGKGWVCETDGQVTGFAIADLEDHNVWALFVLPGFEGNGIGRQLHDTMLDWYFTQTKNAIWLSTSPGTRAEGFYLKAGWKQTGVHGKNEIKFEMTFDNWLKLKADQQ